MRNNFYKYVINSEKIFQSKRTLDNKGNRRVGLFVRFTQALMRGGKKEKAEILFYQTLKKLQQKEMINIGVFTTLENAVSNTQPSLCLKRSRISGSVHLTPFALEPEKKECTAIRWIIKCAAERRHKPGQKGGFFYFSDFLAIELSGAASGLGAAAQMRGNVHKLAESNRASVAQRYR